MVETWMQDMESLLAAAPTQEQLAALPERTQIDLVTALERARASLSAVQARTEVAFRENHVETQEALGMARKDLGRGVADQIALARRISPSQASKELTFHRVLVDSLPRTLALLEAGEISDWGAAQVARHVLLLDDDARDEVDRRLEPVLPTLTAVAAGRRALALAQSIDPASAVRRNSAAVASRRVGLRPAPDGMSHLHALVPVQDGVAMIAALRSAAATARASGDEGALSMGAVMADTLVERVTGVAPSVGVPVEIQLIMTDTTLLADGEEGATLEGHPLPGRLARGIALGGTGTTRSAEVTAIGPVPTNAMDPLAPITSAGDSTTRSPSAVSPPATPSPETSPSPPSTPPPPSGPGVAASIPDVGGPAPDVAGPQETSRWIRRLYTDPVTGELTAMDTRRRFFTGAVRRHILVRDQHCRTPWCDAPARHIDHVDRAAHGGATSVTNGAGHCERFNHVRELPGWDSWLEGGTPASAADPDHHQDGPLVGQVLRIVTPTGHEYTSQAPALRDPAA